MFSHLHVHTEYSLLDGMCRIPQLIARTKELGMDSLAITDHGAMYGVIDFYLAAREAGIKPILGCEVYITPESRFSRKAGDKNIYHLILLAKNLTGYHNLLQLSTKAHLEGFYYKPRVDKELLQEHHEGLIALTSCVSGEIPRLILQGLLQEAKDAALWYRRTFGDFYLEIQRHPMPELEQTNPVLISMGQELDIPLVATSDAHYINREDAPVHDLLLCIQSNTTVLDEKRRKMAGDFFYLKSPKEMEELFKDLPQALENTRRIVEMCNLEIDFGRIHLPEIELPQGKTADQFLAEPCRDGLNKRYPNPTPEIEKRLQYELEVIAKTNFANYFLVVWDIIRFAKEKNILFGVRGSAAASIVLHCLGITAADPIEHRLVFERFLNIERKEMPDIDMDFEDERRDEIIAYVSQKYGKDHVAQIITFGTLGARAAIRDIGRALGMTYSDVDRVARLVPFGPSMTLDKALEENNELHNIYTQDSVVRKLVDTAKKVEGIARHASTHAAGIVISREPLTLHVPLQQVSKGGGPELVMTQFTMESIAKIGLLKMDFLGLANLTILDKARDIIRQTRGVDVDLHHIPMDDKKTFDLLSSGETAGVFQLEGAGMRRHIKELKPTCFGDIAAMVALYRPGPMEHIPTFIKAKHGIEPIRYPHPALKSILEETYGVIVYQDQVLFIVRTFAGYTLGQADIFRKAMGKKIPEVMKKEKQNFIEGAKRNGFAVETAEAIFALIEPFAGYAFNKAHSVSYALIAYQTAYFKANYPAEYMTAFLIANSDVSEKVASAINECRRLGITALQPDINRSQVMFSIEKDKDGSNAIRYGLAAIKNVGPGAVEPVIAERERGGEFKSIEDLCRRADLRGVNRRVMESLIKAGAMDSLGRRGALLQNIDRILSLAQQEQKLRETGQSTMFDLFGKETSIPMPSLDLVGDDVSAKDKLAWEKELMGVYLSEHPFSPYAGKASKENAYLCGQIDTELAGQSVRVAGMVVSVSQLFTNKDRRPFVSAILEDLDGSIEVMVWPKVYADTKDLWEEGNILLIEGKVKVKDERVQLSCDRVTRYQAEMVSVEEKEVAVSKKIEKVPEPEPVRHRLTIGLTQTNKEDVDITNLHKLLDVLRDFPGQDEVNLRIINGEKVYNLKLAGLYINYCPELHQRIVEVVGEDGLKVETR